MTDKFSIMIFSWNTSGLRLCETTNQDKANSARQGFKAFVTMKKPCVAPDFFEDIRTIISQEKNNLVVMSTSRKKKLKEHYKKRNIEILMTTGPP